MAGKFSVQGIFKMNDAMSGPIAKIESRFERMQRRVGAGMSNLGSGIGKAWSSTGKWASGVADRAKPLAALGDDLKTVGVAAAAAGAAAGGGLVSIMQTGMTFEKALLSAGNKFEAGISKDSETFQRLSAVAQQVGGSTEFSATQAANGLKELAGAGLDAGQAMAALPGTVNLATAAEMEDMAAATEIAVKSLGAFGLMSKDPLELSKNLERVSDVLVKTDDISSTSVPAFFEAIAEGGAIAKTAGAKIETYGALVAGLSTIEQGSKAGTTLKNMFLTLSAPTNEAAEAFTRFGIKTTDSLGNTRDAIDVLKELKSATSKLGTGDRAGVLEQIFGKIPLAGVMTLMDNIDEVEANRGRLQNEAGGSVNKKAASMRSGGTGAWDNFTSGIEAVSLAIFEVVGGPMNKMINSTTEWIGQFKGQAIPAVKQFVSGLTTGFQQAWPAIKGAVDILFKGFSGKSDWLVQVKDFAVVLGKVTAGAVGFAIVFGGMVVAGLQIVGALVGELIGLWNGLINGIGAALFAVSDFFANIAAKWEAFSFADWGKRMMQGLVEGIKNGAKWVMDALQGLADKMINKLKSALMIHSPSKRTKPIGKFSAMGLGDGWEDQMPKVDRQIQRSIDVSAMVQPKLAPPLAVSPVLSSPYLSKWTMPSINALPLGSDAPSPAAAPQVAARGGSPDGGSAGRDELEITVRAADGSAAEVTKKPKSRLITLKTPPSGGP